MTNASGPPVAFSVDVDANEDPDVAPADARSPLEGGV